MNPIFVYGLLKDLPGTQPARVTGYRLIDCGPFPAAVPFENGQIIGQVLHVSDEQRAVFDSIEGTPHFYTRDVVKIQVDDQEEIIEGEMYVINDGYWERPSNLTGRLQIKLGTPTTYEYTI